jgi:hypothetical protein
MMLTRVLEAKIPQCTNKSRSAQLNHAMYKQITKYTIKSRIVNQITQYTIKSRSLQLNHAVYN